MTESISTYPVLNYPSNSNTRVDRTMATVSWFSASRPAVMWEGDAPSDQWDLFRLVRTVYDGPMELYRGDRHYAKGVVACDGQVQVRWEGLGGASGTQQVTVRQTILDNLGPDAGYAFVLALLRAGLRPSRVDLAADTRSARTRPRDLFQRRYHASTRTDRAGWQLREDGTGRQTLYVGRRASDRFGRIYDHAMPDGSVVFREELETKGHLARRVGEGLLAGAQPDVIWAAEYARLVVWPESRRRLQDGRYGPGGAT